MIQKMLLSLNFGNSLIRRNPYLLHGMGNQYQFIFPAVTALSISGLVCLLAFQCMPGKSGVVRYFYCSCCPSWF